MLPSKPELYMLLNYLSNKDIPLVAISHIHVIHSMNVPIAWSITMLFEHDIDIKHLELLLTQAQLIVLGITPHQKILDDWYGATVTLDVPSINHPIWRYLVIEFLKENKGNHYVANSTE